jgi:hypothetical protein
VPKRAGDVRFEDGAELQELRRSDRLGCGDEDAECLGLINLVQRFIQKKVVAENAPITRQIERWLNVGVQPDGTQRVGNAVRVSTRLVDDWGRQLGG